MDSVLRDLESPPLTAAEKALLRFVGKVNRDSPNIGPAHFAPLREHHWTDEQINRWIDATGVHALSGAAHREGGKRSAAAGHVGK